MGLGLRGDGGKPGDAVRACGWGCMGCEGEAVRLVRFRQHTTREAKAAPMCRSCAEVHESGSFSPDWLGSEPLPSTVAA